MNNSELEIIEKWQSDPSFINWVKNKNEADVIKWDAYFKSNPQHLELAEVAKFSIEISPKPIRRDKEKSAIALANLKNKISTSSKENQTKTRKMTWLKPLQVAATLLILIGCFWGYSVLNSQGEEIVISTQDEQKEVKLADGSKVILNTYSSLKYFENEARLVELTGEAYFEVAKKPASKALFQVKTEDLTVTVLGTEFNVNSESGQTSVYLDEGKVKLSLGDISTNEIQMQPGELVSYSKKKNKILENRKAKSLEKTAWKEKVILFKDAPISEVLETVSLIYGVKFQPSSLTEKDQTFTGGIPVNDLEIALKTLQDIYQLEIKKNEEKYIIEERK